MHLFLSVRILKVHQFAIKTFFLMFAKKDIGELRVLQ